MSASSSPLLPPQVFAGLLAGGYIDTDGTLAANSDSKLATQKAVKTAIAAAGGGGGTMDCCRVTNSSGPLTITTGTPTDLLLDAETYDNNAMHDNSVHPERVTCVTTGKYHLSAAVIWAGSATGGRTLSLVVNGSTTIALKNLTPWDANDLYMSVETDYALTAGDYVTVNVSHGKGSNLNINHAAGYSPIFAVHMISA